MKTYLVYSKAKELLAKVEELQKLRKDKLDILIEKDIKKLNNMLAGFI